MKYVIKDKEYKKYIELNKKDNKCIWIDLERYDSDHYWRPECSPDNGFTSGDYNDLSEMENTYTFCPKCGKEIEYREAEEEIT